MRAGWLARRGGLTASLAWTAGALAWACGAGAAEFVAHDAADVFDASKQAKPGDVIVMADGDWTDQHVRFNGFGSGQKPITLRAQTAGRVILNGSSRLELGGRHLVVDGLRFEGGRLGQGQHVVRFRSVAGDAHHSRLTNTAIVDYNPPDRSTRYFWVSLHGTHNRVDHSYFKNHNHSGVTVVAWLDGDPNHHRIDHNHFADRPDGGENGWETIRIGTSTRSLTSSATTVEHNLFERAGGEIEIISNKSGDNVYRHNTFLASPGTLTLRHGNDATVEGNFFLGQGVRGTGGVRVIGERHRVINNYFADLDDRADGAVSISAGVPDPQLNQYFQVKDAVIAHNTVVNVDGAAIRFDHGLGSSGRTLLPENVTVANNLIDSTNHPLFTGQEGEGWTWQGNLVHGVPGIPLRNGLTIADLDLVLGEDGLRRPGPDSPAIDAAVGQPPFIVMDMDGQPRTAPFDVGADERSDAPILYFPLTPDDVGPAWLHRGDGPITGDFDGDGDVDGFDLAVWQTGFGTAAGANRADGDADGDGDVDAFDLGLWQLHFGRITLASPVTEVSHVVPEPSTAASSLIAALMLSRARLRPSP